MNKAILRLAIPNIISNISVPLLGVVDLALMGHLGSELYIGAIALGGMIFSFIYSGFGFLRMASSGLTAQAYGRKNMQELMLLLSRGLLVALVSSVLLIILQKPIALISFYFFDGSTEVEHLALAYYNIRIWAAPATIGLYAMMGWFIGMQNAIYPMLITVVINIFNIVFNIVFVYYFGMKAEGVALGTVLAQYCGLIMAGFFFWKKYKSLIKYWSLKLMMQLDGIKNFMHVNMDIFIRTICLIFVLAFFTSKSAGESDETLAVNTLLLQFFFVFSYFIDGFAHAAEALVGKHIGAKEKDKLKTMILLLFKWGALISIPFSLLYFFFADNILFLLTNNTSIIEAASPYNIWVAVVPILTFVAFIWDGVFVGATASKAMRNTLLISSFLVFLPAYYLVKEPLGNHGLWLALMLFMLSRGVVMTILSKKIVFEKSYS